MKNKRNKLANFFTIVVLLFGISLLLWNCETDNVMDSHYHVSKDVDYNLERLGYDDLIIDKEIEKSLPKIQQRFFKKNQSEYKSKNTLEVSEQFSIITDSVNKVSTKYIITWAFKIKKPVLKSSDFENFLIKKENDEFSYFLISYKRDKDDKYQEANLYPISEESLNVDDLHLKTDYIEEDSDGSGGGSGCPGRVIHLPCSNGDTYIHGPEEYLNDPGSCSGTTTILDFSDCFSYGGPETPSNDSNTTVPDNNNSQNNGGGSSSGGSVITSPVTLECDNCTSAQTVASYLNLTDQNQIDWVNDTNNQQSVIGVENFGNANQWSQQAINFALEAINAFMTGGEVDFEERIIIDKTLKDKPCQKGIVKQSYQNKSDLANTVKNVFSSLNPSNIHLKFGVKDLPYTGQLGSTSPEVEIESNSTDPTIKQNTINIYFDTDFLNQGTDLAIAATSIHEQVHALLVHANHTGVLQVTAALNPNNPTYAELIQAFAEYQDDPQDLTDTQHDYMTSMVNEMTDDLFAFTQQRGIDVDKDYCEKIIWGGLEETQTFKNKYPEFSPNSNIPNPEHLLIINAVNAEAKNKTVPFADHPDGNDYTVSPKGKPCND